MTTHAKRSASQIKRIIKCPGSVDYVSYLISRSFIPAEETSVYADEGTMLHTQQEQVINGEPFTEDLTPEQEDVIGDNYTWFHELSATHGFTSFKTETQVVLDGFGIEDCGGTADVIAEGQLENIRSLHSIDWKFGRGVYVDGKKNEQLMTYLLGALENEEGFDKYDEYWIHLAQPRLENFESYCCSKDELMGLVNAIKNAVKSHDINPGQEQCMWCRGKVHCAEYQSLATERVVELFDVNKRMQENTVPFEELVKILKYEDFVKKVFKTIRDHFNTLDPQQLAQYKLKRVAGRSYRQYIDPEAVVRYLSTVYNIDDIYQEPKIKSPAMMEKALSVLKRDAKFQELIHKPVGGPTIVDISDKRPDYDSIGAKGVFAHLKK